jgi:aminopeptidase N
MIAIPGSSAFFGAMENWGAIMYFETALLKDTQVSSESDRRRVFETVAHEMAHQWFGNLVTMDWWTDLWLNEGYATWMETKVAEALHPRWSIPLQVANGPREYALRADAAGSTHPVVQPVESVDAANQVFDAIAYSKGAAVIRMLEAGVGENAFREGIRRYMQRYAYGNAVTDELWAEIAAASGQPVTEIAHDFTLQPGVPLVTLASSACESGHTQVTLSQGRFETGPQSPGKITWNIPLTVTPVDGGAPVAAQLGKDGAPATIDIPQCGPFIANSGQRGYFRTQYSEGDIVGLRGQLTRIADVDQIGLLNDTFALAQAGRAPATSYLDLAAAVPGDSAPQVIGQLANAYLEIDRLFDGSPQQAAWRALARNRLGPIFDHIGWLPAAGEDETVPLLRETLIRALGRFDDPAVIASARQRFSAAAKTPSELPAAIFSPVLTVVAQHADATTWNDIRNRATATTDPMLKQQLFSALGRALDPALAAQALELALAVDTPAPVVTRILAAVAADHPAQAFDFALQREAGVMAHVDTASRWGFVPFLAAASADPAMAQKVGDYRDRFVPMDARQDSEEAIAAITDRAAAKARQLPALEAWVRDYKPGR